MSLSSWKLSALAFGTGLAMVAADVADARVGGGRSLGSRGTKTYTAPPVTKTAPAAEPIQRSMTDRPGPAATAPGQRTGPAAAPQSQFGGWRGLLTGALLATALGSIFGAGALVSMLGFLLQFALIGGAIYFVVNFLRSRNGAAPVPARGSGRLPQDTPNRSRYVFSGSGGRQTETTPLAIAQEDFESFERLLGEIQTAYGREDVEELGARMTPEMLSYLSGQLHDNQQAGLHNQLSDVKLLQGDLSESWRENGSDYATAAMRYSLTDVTRDRATGAVVSGDAERPSEVTELWTFRRDDRARADGWQLSAIQQAS